MSEVMTDRGPLIQRGEVTLNLKVGPGLFLTRFHLPQIAERTEPGQFIHILVDDGYEMLLRRPFSVCRKDDDQGWVEIFYEDIGRGTRKFSIKEPGDTVEALGPLGNGFRITDRCKRGVMVGGGRGVAPLVILAEKMIRDGRDAIILAGVRYKDLLYPDLDSTGAKVFISSEDGSVGQKGFVTDFMAPFLDRNDETVVFTCGPERMMEKVAHIACEHGVPCQASIEEKMGCGLGVCLGCIAEVPGSEGDLYQRVCTEGPVFDGEEVFPSI